MAKAEINIPTALSIKPASIPLLVKMIDDAKETSEVKKHSDNTGNGQYPGPCKGNVRAKTRQCQQGTAEINGGEDGGFGYKNVQDSKGQQHTSNDSVYNSHPYSVSYLSLRSLRFFRLTVIFWRWEKMSHSRVGVNSFVTKGDKK